MASSSLEKESLLYENLDRKVRVFKGTFSGRPAAIKEQLHLDLDEANVALREAFNQAQLNHDGICRIYDCRLSSAENNQIISVIIVELMDHDLYAEVHSRGRLRQYWSESEILQMLQEVVDALSYAQSRGISHRDIKPQNLFLSQGRVKIGDFGSSKGNLEAEANMHTLQGSPFYLSPELKLHYLSDGTERAVYDPFRADVYSLGVTFLCVARLQDPIELVNVSRLRQETEKLLQDLQQFPILQALLAEMLEIDPRKRIGFEHLLQRLRTALQLPVQFPSYVPNYPSLSSAPPPPQSMPQGVSVQRSKDLPVCPICGLFQVPDCEDSVDVWGQYCTCAQLIEESKSDQFSKPKCPVCQRPLSRGGCACPAKCIICSQPISSSDWTSSLPVALDRFESSFSVLCSLRCLILMVHEAGYKHCLGCHERVRDEDLEEKRAVRLECGHCFNTLSCFHDFEMKCISSKRDCGTCFVCKWQISPAVVFEYLGKPNIKNLRLVRNFKACSSCDLSAGLVSQSCGHYICVECALSKKACRYCSNSICATF